MKLRHLAALLILPLSPGWVPHAHADEWQLVLSDRERRVEIDRASIFDSDRGTKVSWGRVVLAPEEARKAGYGTVRALNRYDCMNRSFFTIKRVYLDTAGRVVREEAVTDTSPVMVTRNSVDERMWREVCRPPTVSDLQKVAAAAGRSAAETRPVPTPAAKPAAAELKPAPSARTETKGAAPTPPVPPKTEPAATPAAGPAPAVVARAGAAETRDPPRSEGLRPADFQAPQAAAAARPATPAATPVSTAAAAPATPATPTTPVLPGTPGAPPVAAAPAAPAVPTPVQSAARAPAPRAAPAPVEAAPRPAALEQRWSYDGETGPEHWARLRPDWRVCGDGKRQSPIDLREGVGVDLEPVRFDYRSTRFRIADTGTTLQVNVGEGMGMEVRGRRYELTHFTLHRPSEERVGGRAADMTVHFHHRDAEGRLAMVSVMLERGAEANPLLQALWNNLPLEKGTAYMPASSIDLGALLPASPGHFLYMGSLTTPPCTEGVLWVVMKTPVTISDEQLGIFARLYPRNARPIQPANGRLILESR
ncbi:putative carbonic anhydrase [Azoarcus olearius]|uniref:carbonic anhydrase n=1 Tax=Azoarcus sp. (strain BH72) TaxID=418699 RepID=UPI0008061E89|nr:surface-adhesin E family protein [Azoarcus olearius]ANQ83981.1 putative carbonic anhydrase [Azoarcus olearius]